MQLTATQYGRSNKAVFGLLVTAHLFFFIANLSAAIMPSTDTADRHTANFLVIVISACIILDIVAFAKYRKSKVGMWLLCISGMLFQILGICTIDFGINHIYVYIVMLSSIGYLNILITGIVCITTLVVQVVKIIVSNVNLLETIVPLITTTSICIGACIFTKLFTKIINENLDAIANGANEREKMTTQVIGTIKQVEPKFEEIRRELGGVIEHIDKNRDFMHTIAESMENTSTDVQNQAAATNNIQQIIKETEQSMTIINECVVKVVTGVKGGMLKVDKLDAQSNLVNNNTTKMSEAISKLSKRVEDVSGIVKTILSISEQTNLLALNASIEAARAGEAGKGFSVVANEIRTLAEDTKQSSNKITAIIEDLKKSSEDTLSILQESVQNIKEQGVQVSGVHKEFIETRNNMGELSQRVEQIVKDIQTISASNETVVHSVDQLSAITQEVAGTSQEGLSVSENVIDKIQDFDQNMGDMFTDIFGQLGELQEMLQ